MKCIDLEIGDTIMRVIFESIGQLEVSVADEVNRVSRYQPIGLLNAYMGEPSCWCLCAYLSFPLNVPSI